MVKKVTIDVLKASQRSRPRHWIPVFGWIGLVLFLLLGLVFMGLLFTGNPYSDFIVSLFPDMVINIGGTDFSLLFLLTAVFFPAGIAVLGIFFLIFALRICTFRYVYWWLGIFLLLGLIAQALFTIFFSLFYLVPVISNSLAQIPASVMDTLLRVYYYTTLIFPFVFAFFWLLCIFYNVNYPAKYEEIYELRARRIKAYKTSDERIAYKKRFYEDYKRGNWVSMMLDLHFDALEPGSAKPIREDALEFMIYYTGLADATIDEAVINQYVREQRYKECRDIFHAAKAKSEAVGRGAKIVLPHYVPAPEKKRKLLKSETPKRVAPPAPAQYKKPQPSKVKTWTPDDIN